MCWICLRAAARWRWRRSAGGADFAALADRDREAVSCIRRNGEKLRFMDAMRIYAGDWRQALSQMKGEERRFDLVFLDPPLPHAGIGRMLCGTCDLGLLEADAAIGAGAPAGRGSFAGRAFCAMERPRLWRHCNSFFSLPRERVGQEETDVKKGLCVYPGSFDPVTIGHLDLIERGADIFPEVVVAVLHNPAKEGCFPIAQRLELLSRACAHLPNVRFDQFDGLLVDYMKKAGCRDRPCAA